MTLEELCKRLEELTRECDRIALEIVQRRAPAWADPAFNRSRLLNDLADSWKA